MQYNEKQLMLTIHHPPCDNINTDAKEHIQGSDYPTPRAVSTTEEVSWQADKPFAENAVRLGKALAQGGDLFRLSGYGNGLLFVPPTKDSSPVPIRDGRALAPLIIDRLRIVIKEGDKTKYGLPPARDLNILPMCETFLQQFQAVDEVTNRPIYLPGIQLAKPGHNDGGPGYRVLYLGEKPPVADSLACTNRFLDVMSFASEADRTNAVAAALTVLLRREWAGSKPVIVTTSTKSHGGKGTILQFAAGTTQQVPISYQATEWALERVVVAVIKTKNDLGIIVVDNARLTKASSVIASGFLERLITDPEPFYFSTGTGAPMQRRNDLVLALTTNYGQISEDLMNRALPIHLEPVGNIADRVSPIGNPKLEYLPTHQEQIEAEMRGLIERWKDAGRPLDMDVRHPFTEWARTIGGILKVNGFRQFLANYSVRRTSDDPRRQSLGVLGAARPDEWLSAGAWAKLAVELGVDKLVIPPSDNHSERGRQRGIGVVLTAHREETFHAETDSELLTLKLEKARKRFTPGAEPETRYEFKTLFREPLPCDEDDQHKDITGNDAQGDAPAAS